MENLDTITMRIEGPQPSNVTAHRLDQPVNPLYTELSIDSRSNKTIEIVVVPDRGDIATHRKNVGIELDETIMLEILSKHYRHVSITQIRTHDDLEQMAIRRPDLVFSGVKFFHFNGRELWLNDFLDLHNIAYIASSKVALNNEQDKARAKRIIQESNIATAGYFLTAPGEHALVEAIPLDFPLFVKPVTGGDSRGVDANSIVHDFESFQRKVLDIHKNQKSSALVETYLSGREYSVGILEDASSGNLRAMPIEIIAAPNQNGDRILDYDIKKQDAETVEPVTDMAVHAQLSDLAKLAFCALGGKSLGRIDVKMNHENVPHFIEANLMPGLRKGYFYRGCALNYQMSYEDMILTIASNGFLTSPPNSETESEYSVVPTLELATAKLTPGFSSDISGTNLYSPREQSRVDRINGAPTDTV